VQLEGYAGLGGKGEGSNAGYSAPPRGIHSSPWPERAYQGKQAAPAILPIPGISRHAEGLDVA